MNRKLTFLDFFAGIGGFHKGMEQAGHECVGFCEFDKYATASYTSMYLLTDEQREHLSALDLKKRQKEILKDEYRNGMWYSDDIRRVNAGNVPYADCWCFGAPCQSFSVAGKRAGLDGQSGLIKEVFRILGEQEERDRPEWLIYENVAGMLSSSRGFDFLAILCEMEKLGYNIEWDTFNSKDWGVPQNRVRVYTVGHLRKRGSARVFPLEGPGGENSLEIKQIGMRGGTNRNNPQRNRVYDVEGLAPTLNAGMGEGGNTEPDVAIKILAHRKGYRRNTQVFAPDGITETLSTCQGGGREHHTVVPIEVIGNLSSTGQSDMDVMSPNGVMRTSDTMHEPKKVAIPIDISLKDGIGGVLNVSHTLMSRDYKGIGNQRMTAVMEIIPSETLNSPVFIDKNRGGSARNSKHPDGKRGQGR